ncbi:MAG: GxxExxY protein [Verrucomicrobiales bacterium]|nr:GxxExxY protein [Verrucomicrobiales bacterium]
MEFNDQSYAVIGAAMEVHNEVGPGLREKPYENALVIALKEKGFQVQPQKAYPIYFHNQIVGDCIPDVTIDSSFLVEAKAIDKIGDNEIAQMLNYLRIAKLEVGLVINFKNPKLDWKRVVREQR